MLQFFQVAASPYLPHMCHRVTTTTEKQTPIGAEYHREHPICMTMESVEAAFRLDIPYTYGIILTATSKQPAITTESYRPDTIGKTSHGSETVPSINIP